MKPNLAIVSPSLNAHSETFIQAHKRIPDMNVHFYYGDPFPIMLEDKGALRNGPWEAVLTHYLGRLFGSPFLDRREYVFARSLRKEKIDCVLAEYGTTGVGILNVCRKLRLPLVVTFLGYDASVHQILRRFEDSYKDMFQYVRAVVVVSKAMQKKLEDIGCPAGKIHYSPTGPHDMFFNVQPAFSQKLFISTGRFVDKKAHYYTILAFNEVLEKHPDARLVIAGEGMLLNACINLVRHLRIEHAVSFPGVITLDQFSSYLAVARAYVQHSIIALDGDMEGTPVAVMEASAAGLPVISTRHAGISDVIVDGETGLLIDEHDVEGMSRQMVKILEENDFAKNLGAKGKNFIAENFSREKHLDLLAKIINESLTSNGN